MKDIDFNNLIPVPEEKMKAAIERLEKTEPSHTVCPECGQLVTATDHPYAYNPQENEIVYISICPNCCAAMYSRD